MWVRGAHGTGAPVHPDERPNANSTDPIHREYIAQKNYFDPHHTTLEKTTRMGETLESGFVTSIFF